MMRYGLAILLAALPVPSTASARQLGFDGLAPVRIGMSFHQVEQVLHAKLSIDFENDDGPDGCGIASVPEVDGALSYMFENRRITRIDLGGESAKSTIKTAAGIGLGSSIGAIRHAYGQHAKSHPNAYDEREPDFEIKSADGKAAIVFETEHGHVVRIHAGRLLAAEYIEGCS